MYRIKEEDLVCHLAYFINLFQLMIKQVLTNIQKSFHSQMKVSFIDGQIFGA
jgi:hypothetical protein